MFPVRLGAPTSSRITSNGPRSTKPSVGMTSAPSAATCSCSASLRTVAVTRAPAAAASWIAAVPTPPAAPWIRTRSPSVRWPCVKRASWAVVKTSGTPPAAGQSSDAGTAISWRSWTTASSAWPPPPTIAITRSPIEKRVAPAPSRATSPASSSPGMSWGTREGRVAALELHHVGPVEAGCADADEDLPAAGGSGSGCSRTETSRRRSSLRIRRASSALGAVAPILGQVPCRRRLPEQS